MNTVLLKKNLTRHAGFYTCRRLVSTLNMDILAHGYNIISCTLHNTRKISRFKQLLCLNA